MDTTRPSTILLRPGGRFPETTINEVAGCLRPKGKPRGPKRKAATLAQMDAAIAREVIRRHDRGQY
jgi:hypothetical protein